MNFTFVKKIIRKIYPLPIPPVISDFENICDVQLVPHDELKRMYIREMAEHSKSNSKIVHLEFGIFNGTSISAAFKAYEELGYDEIKIFAFDSFLGLPSDISSDDGGVWEPSLYSCDKSRMKKCLEEREIDPNKITFIDGWFKDTLNERTRFELDLEEFDIAFIDCDTYSSSILCLSLSSLYLRMAL